MIEKKEEINVDKNKRGKSNAMQTEEILQAWKQKRKKGKMKARKKKRKKENIKEK